MASLQQAAHCCAAGACTSGRMQAAAPGLLLHPALPVGLAARNRKQQQQQAGRSCCELGLGHAPQTRRRHMQVATAAAGVEEVVPALAASSDLLYEASQRANELVAQQLQGITPVTYGAVLLAGLATSLSPCTLSVLPLTIGYIGGYARTDVDSLSSASMDGGPGATVVSSSAVSSSSSGSNNGSGKCCSNNGNGGPAVADAVATARATSHSNNGNNGNGAGAAARPKPNLGLQALSFSLGLATTLAGLGVLSTSLGSAYGAIGDGAPLAVSLLAIAMGLNLLEVLPLQLPSLDVDVRTARVPPAAQAYLAGLAFALAASPCSTPVLATLLAWVGTTKDPLLGGSLLLAYTTGYVAPLLLAASATGSMKRILALRKYSAWVTPASGALLVAGGTFTLLSRVVPA